MQFQQPLVVGLCICFPVTLFATAPTIPNIIVKKHPVIKAQLHHSNYVAIITHKQIQRSGATSISQLLANQAGIQLQDLTGDGSSVAVSMRGFGANASSNTLILVNGVPQNNPDLAGFNFNKIPIQDVQRIEITQGSQGVLYGDEAVGGVINIITKSPHKRQAHAAIGYGSYNHQIYHADISDRFKDGLSYLLSATKNKTDNYRQHNNDNENNLDTQIGYHYATGNLLLNYNFYNQRLLYAGALTAAQVQQNRRQSEELANLQSVMQNNLNLRWQQMAGANWLIKTNIANHNGNTHGFLFGDFSQTRHTLFINPIATGKIHHTHIIAGYGQNYDRYTLNSILGNTFEEQTIESAYTLINQPLYKKLSLNAGLRGAYLDTHNHAVVTQLGLQYEIDKAGLLYLKRAGNYRFPKTEDNAQRPLNSAPLKTQTGASYDLGFKWMAPHYQINLDSYIMHLRNEIVFDPRQTPSQPFGANRNLSPTNRYGFNVGLTFPINKVITLDSQYSFIDARFNSGPNQGKHIPFVAENTLQLSSTISFTEHWHWYSELLFTGKRYAAGDDANVAGAIPSISIVNTNISYTRKRFTLSCRLNNIFNELYNAYTTYQPTNNSEFFYPAPGRNIMMTATIKFI